MPVHEHSALGESFTANANPDIPEADQKTVKAVMRLFNKYKRSRSKYDRNWMHYYKIFRGNQWSRKRPSYRHSEVINFVFQAIQSSVPLQTDVRPNISFLPQEPTDKDLANVLNKISESDWDRNNWLEPLTEVILDGYLYGTGFSSLQYDQDADFGMGSAVYESEDPFYCYPDPEARDINGPKSKGFFHAEPVDTESVKSLYPDQAHLIKADVSDFIRSTKTSLNDFRLQRVNADLDMASMSEFDGNTNPDNEKRTMVITAYLKPEETEELKESDVDEQTGEENERFILRKKFPRGRKVVIASGVLLVDEPLPYEHGNIPFSRYVNYILPREFFGISEVEQLESPQRTFNKLLNFTMDITTLMGNPVWIVDQSSGVDPRKIRSEPGLVIEKQPGTEVRREEGVQLQPYILQLTDRLVSWFNDVAGTQDVTRGATPGSVTAASAIEQLQEAARTRIRQKQRNLDAYIKDWGQQYVDVILEKYSAPRVFRVTNNEGDAQFFKFNVDRETVDDGFGGQKDQLTGVLTDLSTGEENPAPKRFLISGRFDVSVNTGSSLPFTVADKETKTLNLFDRGILDEEEVLNQLEYPNKEKILERLRERQEQAAQAEQAGATK